MRVNDNGYEQAQENNDDNKYYMAKLWGFINNQKIEPKCEDYICKFKQGDYDTLCASNNASDKYNCRYCRLNGQYGCDVYDENGVRISKKDFCNSELKNCRTTNIYRENGTSLLSTKVGCDDDGEKLSL